jgi:hypothetical protein
MSYIRAKEIPRGSGNWYDYEVESVWNKGKVIQKHIRYVGVSTIRGSHVGIVRPDNLPDMDYKVSLHQRRSVTKGKPVADATLTPIVVKE